MDRKVEEMLGNGIDRWEDGMMGGCWDGQMDRLVEGRKGELLVSGTDRRGDGMVGAWGNRWMGG